MNTTYLKVLKVIKSCQNWQQVDVASRMVDQYVKLLHDPKAGSVAEEVALQEEVSLRFHITHKMETLLREAIR